MNELAEKTLATQFQARQHIYEPLRVEALFIANQALEDAGIKIHSISARIKTIKSFLDKAKAKELREPLNDIHDIVGLRIVCLFLSDIGRIGNLIRDRFLVIAEDNKIEGADSSSFGYMSLHFDVTMQKEHQGPRYDQISGLPFEIQVRTIAMDAWANVSHYLSYKSDKDVPSELRKDFYALSGLFYVADRHFEMFYDISKSSQERMVELFAKANKGEKAEQEINFDSVRAYLASKFPNRKRSDSTALSDLVDELVRAGFTSIGEVDRMFDSASEASERYEQTFGPPIGGGQFTDVGIVRASANIANDKFFNVYLERNPGMPKRDRQKVAEFKKYLK
jgi:putative GTP pyrophosphokinase